MATYKVIQDIEAEDKLLGPLSLRQFLYAVVVVVLGFIVFRLILVAWYLAIPLIPPMILFSVLAAPFVGGQQPSETWLLAKIRYYLLPRKKIWSQSGVKELVKITAPKNMEPERTDGLSQVQVKSRLKALASTLDSRGWAVKNAGVNEITPQTYRAEQPSDRIINPMGVTDMSVMDVHETDDMLDGTNNPVSQTMQSLINTSVQAQRERITQSMQTMQQQAVQKPVVNSPQALATTKEELALSESIKAKEKESKLAYANMKSIQPRKDIDEAYKHKEETKKAQAVTTPVHPDILKLAHNDDLNVATIANQVSNSSDGEVIIKLH